MPTLEPSSFLEAAGVLLEAARSEAQPGGARPAPPPMLGGVPDGPEQLVRNIEAHIRLLEPASRADFRRRLAAARNNISALAELNQAVATAAEENEAADREPEPAPIDREAFEALLAGLTDDSGSEDY